MDAEIIVELLSRIKALEREVDQLSQRVTEIRKILDDEGEAPFLEMAAHMNMSSKPLTERKRDTTRYAFNGGIYSKKGLVYAVVGRYVAEHPDLSRDELKRTFDKSLQGSLGVVENVEIAKQRGDAEYRVRFFADDKQILHLRDGDMVVCTQWGILNIPRFLTVARQLGYQIEALS